MEYIGFCPAAMDNGTKQVQNKSSSMAINGGYLEKGGSDITISQRKEHDKQHFEHQAYKKIVPKYELGKHR